MIVTVTLNASIDKAYQLDTPLVDGTVMRVARCIDNAGGKGMNAARAIKTCGEHVVASGFVGGNNGQLLRDLLDKDGIDHQFVKVKNETRCCINVLDPDGRSTEFLEPGREVTATDIQEMKQLIKKLSGQAHVLSFNGSLPQGMMADSYQELISIVKNEGCFCILDTSGAALSSALSACPDMIKPNADELAMLLDRSLDSLDEIAAAARDLHQQGIAYVVVSLGADGALLACNEGVFYGKPPKIEVVNPVGSGDTMVGAAAVARARNYTASEMLRYALSCATANCLSASTGRFDMSEAERLSSSVSIEQLG